MSGTVVVAGAGIAGVACARELQAAGVPVLVRERARVTGGRMASSRRQSGSIGRVVDFGAQYFTVRTPEFRDVVDGWVARGLARPWTDSFHVLSDGGLTGPVSGPVRYAAELGIRHLVEDLAAPLSISHQDPVRLVEPGPVIDGVAAAAVVLAMPDPQALRVLHPQLGAECAALSGRAWLPALSLTARFAERSWPADMHGAFVHSDPKLTWIADDGRRRGDAAPVLVAHSSPAFAAPRLSHPSSSGSELTAALCAALDLPRPVWAATHRWSFARPQLERDESFHLGPARIGLAGCGWGSPRVETAFLSGRALGRALAERLAG